MASIGLHEHHKRRFPSSMILAEVDPSDVFSQKERLLVLEYKDLVRRLEENRAQGLRLQSSNGILARIQLYLNNKKYWSIRKRMEHIEESKTLSSLLFRKRCELVMQQHEIEKLRLQEINEIYFNKKN